VLSCTITQRWDSGGCQHDHSEMGFQPGTMNGTADASPEIFQVSLRASIYSKTHTG